MNRRFVVGVDKSKMRLYDTEQSSQDVMDGDKPLMDKTNFGQRDENDTKKGFKNMKQKFADFK